ncbi:MAG: septation ring formation regulator EzrA [bacterium]|nr:septation ring formation regulator EzrA [bacterium]
MEGQILVIITTAIICLIITILWFLFVRRQEKKIYVNKAKELEVDKNLITSTPILLELSKIEPIIKNEMMEEKYDNWQAKFISIKENDIMKIDDLLIDLDVLLEKKEFKNATSKIATIELEIYKTKEKTDNLLDEIKEITLSEEKYRSIVTKLKAKYRRLNAEYQKHKNLYDDMQEAIDLQLENIEKNFLDFEKVMEKNDYTEVVHIVKALDAMINHMQIIVDETPDVLLMAKQLIPKRIKEIQDVYDNMTNEGYPLDYLNIPYNIEESQKNIGKILDKVKILNLEDCMFELKTILDYLDSLFVDFEKERLSKKVYEEIENDFNKKITKTNKIVEELFLQLDDIKNMYDLNEKDLETINEVKKTLVVINDDYKNITGKVGAESCPYSMLQKDIEELMNRLKVMEEDLDRALKSLGNLHDDEERAREQLKDIEQFLKASKEKMRSYKLPIISDNYFVELKEANEAILEVIKELERKPIVIKTLNTRVDTARDLVLKLYNTTNEMIKTATLAEKCIVYSNRYRAYYDEVETGLKKAEAYFYKGEYKKSLDTVLKTCALVDDGIYKKMLAIYDN